MARSKRIMVVDDEAGIRNLLFEVLSGKGFKVTLAKDGQDSLQQMRGHKFDLVITDIDMPRVNGLELLRRMKRAGRREKVIVMTGNTINQKKLEEETLPVITLLDKPFQMDTFLDAVSSAFNSKKKRTKRPGASKDRGRKAVNAV